MCFYSLFNLNTALLSSKMHFVHRLYFWPLQTDSEFETLQILKVFKIPEFLQILK